MKSFIFTSCLFFIIHFSFSQTSNDQPKVVVAQGHSDMITGITASSNGRFLASTALDKKIIIWDPNSQKEIVQIEDINFRIERMSFSGTGEHFVCLDNDENVYVYETQNWQQIIKKNIKGATANNFDIAGESIYYTNRSKKGVIIWDFLLGNEKLVFSENYIHFLRVSPKNTNFIAQIFNGNGEGKEENYAIYKYSIKEEKAQKISDNVQLFATSGGYSNDAKKYALAFWKNIPTPISTVNVYNVQTSELLTTFKTPPFPINDLCFGVGDQEIIPVSISQTTLDVYDAISGNKKQDSFSQLQMRAIAQDPLGKYIAISNNKEIHLIKVNKKHKYTLVSTLKSRAEPVLNLVSATGGDKIIINQNDFKIRIWDLKKNAMSRVFAGFFPVATSPKGQWLAYSKFDNTVTVIDVETGKKKFSIPKKVSVLQEIIFSKDSSKMYLAWMDKTVEVWSLNKKPTKIATYKASISTIHRMAVDPSENNIAVFSFSGELEIINTSTGKNTLLSQYKKYMPYDGYFSEGGDKLVVICYFNKLIAIKTENWELDYHHTPFKSRGICIKKGPEGSGVFGTGVGRTAVSFDNSIGVWKESDGSNICNFTKNFNNVNDVDFHHKKSYIYSGGSDATVKIWDHSKCQEVAKLMSIGEEDFVIITPELYYTGSKGAMEAVGFRMKNNKVYPFDHFDLKLNRPDKVAESIGLSSPSLIKAYKNAYLKRLKKMGFEENMFNEDFHLPSIHLLTKEIPLFSKEDKLKVKINAEDAKYTLDRINLWVNGVPIYGYEGIPLGGKSHKINKDLSIELSEGNNHIQIGVINTKGVASLKESIDIHYQPDVTEGKNKLHLITIGVSKYKDELMNLEYADKDAQAITKLFKSSANKVFKSVESYQFINENATKENVLALKNILQKTNINDAVVIFVASHGIFDKEYNYYLAMHDTDFDHPKEKGLAYNYLEHLLDGIPARNRLIMIDACHSGEIDTEAIKITKEENTPEKIKVNTQEGEVMFRSSFKELKYKVGMENAVEFSKEIFSEIRRGTGTTVISAATGGQVAVESNEWNHGVFTYSLLEYLNTEDDKEIMISDMQNYVRKRVLELTQGKQMPTNRIENIKNDFRIW